MNTPLDTPLQPLSSVKSFSPNDIKYLIHKYRRNKSSGYNLITAEVAMLEIYQKGPLFMQPIYTIQYSGYHTFHFFGNIQI